MGGHGAHEIGPPGSHPEGDRGAVGVADEVDGPQIERLDEGDKVVLVDAPRYGGGAAPAPAGDRFQFAVIGDYPYTPEDVPKFDRLIDAINAEAPALVLHLGDIANVACTTAAAPAMSDFMSLIDDDGLMVRPPESKVTPLPTSARWATGLVGE